jgi:hypothetical protein
VFLCVFVSEVSQASGEVPCSTKEHRRRVQHYISYMSPFISTIQQWHAGIFTQNQMQISFVISVFTNNYSDICNNIIVISYQDLILGFNSQYPKNTIESEITTLWTDYPAHVESNKGTEVVASIWCSFSALAGVGVPQCY